MGLAVKRALELVPDLLGLAGYVAVCSGVGLLWGRAVLLIVAGAPLALAYAWREARIASAPHRKG